MEDKKHLVTKLIVSLCVPLLIVTFGGLIVYQTFSAFFLPNYTHGTGEINGPAAIYYALTFVVALMYFVIRQGYKGYEFIALGLMSVVYSLSMQKLTPGIFRPIYVYILPQLLFFLLMWLVLKYIFLNKFFRSVRLILFALLSSAAFTLTFWLQYALLRQITDANFLQSRFISGLMLFIFMGFGLSLSDFILLRTKRVSGESAETESPMTPAEHRDGNDQAD